jgi:hypothetical protein
LSHPPKPACRAAVLAIAALSLLAFAAATAAAKPRGVVHRSTDIQVKVGGTNGYRVVLQTIGDDLLLSARNGPLAVLYLGKGHSRGDRYHAGLGKLGQISLRFKSPRRKVLHNPRRCEGSNQVEEHGVVTGSFVFKGERGYTKVTAHRIKAVEFRDNERICGFRPPSRVAAGRFRRRFDRVTAPSRHERDLEAIGAAASHGDLSFEAQKRGGRWEINASLFERHKSLDVIRSASVESAGDPIVFGDEAERPATASIAPPPPFLGTATYTASPTPGTLTWDGSLTVPLPGAGTVQLAGKGFQAIACRAKEDDRLDRCLSSAASG